MRLVSFIICSNGYGHLKRVLSIIPPLLELSNTISVAVFCPGSHIELAKREINFQPGLNLDFYSDASFNEISWLNSDGISIQKYRNWQEELRKHPILNKSHLIVSDNHLLPITVFPNVILMGSFLWHDVVNFRNDDVDFLVENEKKQLLKLKPKMICLSEMAMPEVLTKTTPIKTPWICHKYSSSSIYKVENSILITGGGTALINNTLAEIALKLQIANRALQVFVDSKIYDLLKDKKENKALKFGFSNSEFASLSAVICRPGIGILTDCVRYNVPPIAINDGFNNEIHHNARRINELGFGASFDSSNHSTTELVDKILIFFSNKATLAACMSKLQNQKTEGSDFVANVIQQSIL